MKKPFLLFFLVLNVFQTDLNAQQHKIDSLKILLKADKQDTTKLRHLYQISSECENIGSVDEASAFGKEVLTLCAELLKVEKGAALKNAVLSYKAKQFGINGLINVSLGNFAEALKNHFASLEIRKQIGDLKGVVACQNNIGLVHVDQGNYSDALKVYFSALKLAESIDYKSAVAMVHNNIGMVYANQGNVEDALKYCFIALKMKQELGDRVGMISTYNCIATAYYMANDFAKSLENFTASLKLSQELGDQQSAASLYMNIGACYYAEGQREKDPLQRRKKYEASLENFSSSLNAKLEVGGKPGIAGCYVDIATLLIELKKYDEAEDYLKKGRDLAIEIGYKDYAKNAFQLLTVVDSIKGNYKAAYEDHKMYVLYSDSLNNEETRKQAIQSQMTYDFEKKEAVAQAENKIELENQNALAEEKSRKQKVVLFLVAGGLVLVLLFAGFIFRSLRVTRKQKDVIEEQKNTVELQKLEVENQKHIVEEHQKDIIDSIRYARRIQGSLLPTEKYIERSFNRLRKG